MTGLQGPAGNSVAREVGRHLSGVFCAEAVPVIRNDSYLKDLTIQ